VVLVSSKIALPSQTLRPHVGWVASQVAADWAAPLDHESSSKSAAAVAAAALAAAAAAAMVAVAVFLEFLCISLDALLFKRYNGLNHHIPQVFAVAKDKDDILFDPW
jgi:hypothetical protein